MSLLVKLDMTCFSLSTVHKEKAPPGLGGAFLGIGPG
jgi:hypothetical protein